MKEEEFRKFMEEVFAPPPAGTERVFIYRGFMFKTVEGSGKYWFRKASGEWKECPNPFNELLWFSKGYTN